LQFNGISWRVDVLGEETYLLTAGKDIAIEKIHDSTFLIKEVLGKNLTDIVSAYNSIAIFTSTPFSNIMSLLSKSETKNRLNEVNRSELQIPICYELGLDLEAISYHSGLSTNQVVDLHLNGNYRSLFIGFTPGFIYADGLVGKLSCPRKAAPRKNVGAGSVGIGGNQTGIYSLASPGGWNVIGRTPLTLFDPKRDQPMLIEVGTSFQFYRITKEEFESWEN
jgi:KipI family sensor histidine kinase inhibitor